MVDVDVLADATGNPWSPQRQLAGLLQHPLLQVIRYSDDGPPADAPVHEATHGIPKARGWITREDGPPGKAINFWQSHGDSVSLTGVFPGSERGLRALQTTAHVDLGAVEAERRRDLDVVAFAIAQQVRPDLFVTQRPHLLAPAFQGRGLTVCDLAGGLALLGLYLRAQDDFHIWLHPDGRPSPDLGRDFYFWVGARNLLPEAWRWIAACSQHATAIGDDTLFYLALTLPERMTQALKSRDMLHHALNNRSDDGRTMGDPIHAFENVVTALMATLDLTAVVAHTTFALSGSASYASWQSPGWLSKVTTVAPTLAALVGATTTGHDTVTIIRHLRNAIHGIALEGVDVRRGGGVERTRMGLPRARQTELVMAMTNLGGLAAWSVETRRQTGFYADPGVLVERLLPYACDLLNALMRETPVEALPHVKLTVADTQPPSTGTDIHDMFSPPQTACVRALLGV